jgi:hypothetical protein
LLATPRFLLSIPVDRRAEALAEMQAAKSAYGHPYLHADVTLQRFPPFMECSCGRDLRLIFQRISDALVFHLCGTHDEVASFLRNQR